MSARIVDGAASATVSLVARKQDCMHYPYRALLNLDCASHSIAFSIYNPKTAVIAQDLLW